MTGTLLDQLVARTSERFQSRFGKAPQWIVAAPGRVNIIGEHVDYSDGFVLPMAIDRYCVIAAGEAGESSTARIYSTSTDDEVEIVLGGTAPHCNAGHWSNYFAGVIAGCEARGMRPGGFQAVVESDVPVGGGLSSSASIEVATATLVEAMTGQTLELTAKALLCQKAEHDFAGVPCGIMDQFASVMCRPDHLMLLDCRSQQIEQIPFLNPEITVLIINTNVKHELSGGEYAERRSQCESAASKLGLASLRDGDLQQLESAKRTLADVEYRRARHAIGEIGRTQKAAAALKAGDWAEVGSLMYASHESLRDDYEVSCEELDLLVELASKIGADGGVVGSRMTGGGFGGCTVSLVETSKVDGVAEQICKAYRAATGIEPSVLKSRPSRGAHVVQGK